MKVLFIGGTGNISTSVSRLCVERGVELWLLNRSGSEEIAGCRSLQTDIRSANAASLLADHEWDVVVNWIAFDAADAERDIGLFSGKTGQYVFISSASCYKKPGPTPLITERTPLENVHWLYSRNKIAAEQALLRAHQSAGFPVTIVRPSHTYRSVLPLSIGGWAEYTTVQRMKQGLPIVVHGDGTALWTVTHADDFAQGFLGLMGHAAAIGEDFHITSDEFLSWNEIYQLTAAAVGRTAEIVHVTSDRICELDPEYTGTLLGDKSGSALFDNSKVKRLVPDFRARIPFAEGIQRTLAALEANPARKRVNPETNAFIEQLIADARR
jgi:nucleoside-diphosphate-sugar epimerase